MDFFDLLTELRKGEPDADRSAKAMKVLGWLCFGGAAWNCGFYYLAPLDETGFRLPPSFPYLVLAGLAVPGALFLYASRAIRDLEPSGKRAGQAAIVVLLFVLLSFGPLLFAGGVFPNGVRIPPLVIAIMVAVLLVQFGVPAYYGVRYLGRLPADRRSRDQRRFSPGQDPASAGAAVRRRIRNPRERYRDALVPLGLFGSSLLLLVPLALAVFVVDRFAGPGTVATVFFPLMVLLFAVPAVCNFVPSPFQEGRQVAASFTGGGSISLFSGTWPFFRLLVYRDGLEVRVMFHRFFVPYDAMDDIPEKIGFFNRGILIRSDLPDVPGAIRFQGFGMKKIARLVARHRSRFLEEGPG